MYNFYLSLAIHQVLSSFKSVICKMIHIMMMSRKSDPKQLIDDGFTTIFDVLFLLVSVLYIACDKIIISHLIHLLLGSLFRLCENN